ncbi:TPA: hypothetical protein ACU967_005971 [Burkholderia contaminans]|uniref:hypothetical protein n=1 Tax=Burkholderia TaxID=32008 RepID=UPI00075CF4F3|nr:MULTISPECIES: hypothetical protein [Burkholderia]KVS22068.1 hypothetical protein WK34_20755 [Burkholderia vietnamiensis]MBM6430585.1 hypothetical protein [Burkholderia contaminans]MCA7880832.1 hypothetical protein [Burkholderia contaminans]MCB4349264.1 hypothetical protein [Burkholderia vietnamiensis]MDN8025844.1 hypothetical protein [Burkholderia contaminans]
MIQLIDACVPVWSPAWWPLDDFAISTGGAISMSSVAPDVISIAAGYRSASDQPAEIRIDEEALPVEYYAAYTRHLRTRVAPSSAVPARAVPLRERLMAVKAGLGLSTKELAESLRCVRASVYNWLDPSHQGQVNDDAMERLAALEKLTKIWNAYGVGALGGHLHGMALEGEDGRSLFALLKEAPIDLPRCEAALRAIADQCRAQIAASRRVDDLVARGFGV